MDPMREANAVYNSLKKYLQVLKTKFKQILTKINQNFHEIDTDATAASGAAAR